MAFIHDFIIYIDFLASNTATDDVTS